MRNKLKIHCSKCKEVMCSENFLLVSTKKPKHTNIDNNGEVLVAHLPTDARCRFFDLHQL